MVARTFITRAKRCFKIVCTETEKVILDDGIPGAVIQWKCYGAVVIVIVW